MVRGQLVEIGASHQIRGNILRVHNWGVPSVHIKFVYYVTDIVQYLIMLQGYVQVCTQYYNYMHENYYSHNHSESVCSHVWALLSEH